MHSRNSNPNPRLHTDSFGLGGPGGPGDVTEPGLDVSHLFHIISLRLKFVTEQQSLFHLAFSASPAAPRVNQPRRAADLPGSS